MSKKNYNKNIDKKFKIKTEGLRDFKNNHLYNRTESTSYFALEKLTNQVVFNENDCLVDYGSGRGRVCFYINNKFDCKLKGIEAQPLTFDEAIENLRSYSSHKTNYNDKIYFINMIAEDYIVEEEDNIFYFFNPFSLVIYKKVLTNILISLKEFSRKVKIILFYPFNDFIRYMENINELSITSIIEVYDSSDLDEKFIIYEN